MARAFLAIVSHDLSLAWRRRGSVLSSLLFFVIACSLFPLALGPEPQQLRPLAPGILWVAALLASMLSLSRLFVQEHADGSLEQLLLSPYPLALLASLTSHGTWALIAVGDTASSGAAIPSK